LPRRPRPAWLLLLAAGVLPLAAPRTLAGQVGEVVLQGRVIDRGSGAGIVGAGLDLLGIAQSITGENGAFRFARVPSGRHTLEVEMLGYETRRVDLLLLNDTSLIIELDVAPVRLDTLTIRPRFISVRGRVTERATRRGLIDAEVLATPDRRTQTNAAGGYRVRRVPAGPPVSVLVRSLGFMPANADFVADRDTTIDFALDPDPVAQRMIGAQVARLVTRANAVPYMRMALSREELVRQSNWAVSDLLKSRLGPWMSRIQCVVIDDVLKPFGLQELETWLPDQLERLEIINRGVMIRAYSRDYVGRRMQSRTPLAPIMLIPTPGGWICR
jgi:hypothetical protein